MRWLITFIITAVLSACTVYSSAGRKDFETKSPSYVKTLAFEGCDPIEQKDFDQGVLDSFLARSFFSNDNFWVTEDNSNGTPIVQVMDHKKEQVCSYQFTDHNEWATIKPYFIKNLP